MVVVVVVAASEQFTITLDHIRIDNDHDDDEAILSPTAWDVAFMDSSTVLVPLSLPCSHDGVSTIVACRALVFFLQRRQREIGSKRVSQASSFCRCAAV